MRLPDELARAIEEAAAGVPAAALARASVELTERYRGDAAASPPMTTPAHRLAYAVVRVPATYAAMRAALAAVAARVPAGGVSSLLDLGAGPGTAAWAAAEVFPGLRSATLVERDPELVALGRRLAATSQHPALAAATWATADVARARDFAPHDLVLASYVLGELDERATRRVVEAGFAAAAVAFVVVEPGTPRGFERIRAARARLVGLAGRVVAPCPHDAACPMREGDWCHFAARVERTALHRRLKAAAMGHEDEKYAYVAVTKADVDRAPARILRHPLKREGHTQLELCARDGLVRVVVSRRDKEAYRRARKAKWGDEWGE